MLPLGYTYCISVKVHYCILSHWIEWNSLISNKRGLSCWALVYWGLPMSLQDKASFVGGIAHKKSIFWPFQSAVNFSQEYATYFITNIMPCLWKVSALFHIFCIIIMLRITDRDFPDYANNFNGSVKAWCCDASRQQYYEIIYAAYVHNLKW